MRLICSLVMVALSVVALFSQTKRLSSKYLNYIDAYKEVAISQQAQYGIPASITLAQALLESQCGESRLAVIGNNHFGIKCAGGWTGDTIRHDDDELQECFRSYESAEESYRDHSLFLLRKRYNPLFELDITDYKEWAKTLRKCGYATDPAYPEKLIGLIEMYELDQYDDASAQRRVEDIPLLLASKSQVSGAKKKETRDAAKPTRRPATKFQEENTEHQDSWLAEEFGATLVTRSRWGMYYVTAREGDTYASLASELGIKEKDLMKFNDADKATAVAAGDVIWLQQKCNETPSNQDSYTVEEGDELRAVAQRYCIKKKNLAKMNKIKENDILEPGKVLRLK